MRRCLVRSAQPMHPRRRRLEDFFRKLASVRGASLRVLHDFFQENDPGLKGGRSGQFAGLQRIGDPEDGTALWTTLTDPAEVKQAIEARSRERQARAARRHSHRP